MPRLRYKDYYISVFHTPDKSGNLSCVPFVEIHHKRGRGLEVRLMLNEAFSTAFDASAHGFAMGKQWVDEQISQRNPVRSTKVARKTAVQSPIPFRFRSWFMLLLFRLGLSAFAVLCCSQGARIMVGIRAD